ncbi:type VI secretion system baseplate subunit TssE [Paraburkholderia sediminicola]|uniref:type VI secretion system baseplate subunit TssE n=1 Tax=Paraburkholderia TaxID=1822464 RepID=UPI0038BA61AB
MNKPHSLRLQRDPAAATRDSRLEALPCLLDRLTGDCSPTAAGADNGVAPPPRARLRESLLRDLNWLLNTTNLEATDDLAAYPHVRRSVVNFGLGALAGARVSALDWVSVQSAIRETIVQFEPRLLAESVEVRCIAGPSAQPQRSTLSLEIHGQLCSSLTPQTLLLHSEIDLEAGHIALRAQGNG